MFKKAFGCWVLVLLATANSVNAKADDRREPLLIVAVYNQAGVPGAVLTQAEAVGGKIFGEAGLQVQWLNCGITGESEEQIQSCLKTVFPTHLQVRIVQHSVSLSETIFGISYLSDDGTGCYTDIFFRPMRDFSQQLDVNLGRMLGHVMAHEIAHLLLGFHSHAPTGIMRGHWQSEDLADVAQGRLLFTRGQAEAMRRRFSTECSRSEKRLAGRSAGAD